MGKNQLWKDVAAGIGGFGEGFVKTLQAERKRKDEEKQFNQEMSYKIRQQKMMSDIYTQQRETAMRNQALDEDKFASDERSGYIEMSPEPNFPALPMLMGGVAGGEKNKDYSLVKPFQEGKFYTPKQGEQPKGNWKQITVDEDGKPMQYWENPDTGERRPIGKAYYKPNVTNINNDSGEYFDLTKSDEPSRTYDALTKAKWNQEKGKFEVLTANGKNEYTQEELETLKSRLMGEIEDKTNNEARRIGKKVKNFYLEFQEYLKDAKNGILTPDNIDETVNMDYPDAPTEVRESIKSLLKKRVR